ncbi:hypothetical protein B9Z55_018314 [Caenorhabditis nigoni]|uniref:G-protein coupled receptors family 1 profile domain-containing protein n=1 Tax=Caenorhabditis nigoni TaxID=1611254 RepID=A0A2G5TDJ9_9PELO|nr:hypothetical protein B9Z55_018314 [Caenorhabditis nigoni]
MGFITTTTLAPLLNDTDDVHLLVQCYLPQHTKTYSHFSTFINGYVTCAVIIIGTMGNLNGVKSVHVTSIDKNRGFALAVSMLALAFWDTVLLWSAFFYYGFKGIGLSGNMNGININSLVPWVHALSHIANTASTWCVVSITMQRFIATRDPFRSSRSPIPSTSFRAERRISFMHSSKYRRLFRTPLVLSIIAVIFNLPAFFEINSTPCFNALTNSTSFQLTLTWLRKNKFYSYYRVVIRMLLVSVGPNILIIFLSAITLFYLRGSNRSRRQLFQMTDSLLDRFATRESMNTVISVMLVVKFLAFRSLTFALDIFEVIGENTNYYVIDISNLMILINSATNCLIYLKATEWLSQRLIERKTIKRKKTICDSGQLLGDRLSILISSWEKANEMTNGEIGVRVAWNMVRKHPTMCKKTLPEPEKVSLLNGSCKRSIDHAKFQEIGGRISGFIAELLELMRTNQAESYIIMRIRRVGAVHYDKGIVFSSSVWKEFKYTIQSIISEVQFSSTQEREAALDAWNIFISFIIREMKMGIWAIGDTIVQMP